MSVPTQAELDSVVSLSELEAIVSEVWDDEPISAYDPDDNYFDDDYSAADRAADRYERWLLGE